LKCLRPSPRVRKPHDAATYKNIVMYTRKFWRENLGGGISTRRKDSLGSRGEIMKVYRRKRSTSS